jgi:DnaJ-class molecular chaperone
MAEPVNYYEVLNLPRGATEDEIRQRFRQLARERHPDRFPAAEKSRAEAEFQQITMAYNVLVNPERRVAHDFDLDNKVVSETDPKAIAAAYFQKGVEAYRERRWDAALSNFEMAMRHDAENAKILRHFAMVGVRTPQTLRQAVEAIEKAVRLEPRNADFLRDAGTILRQAGLWARAEKCYREAIMWNPDSPELKRGLEDARAHRAPRL